MKICFSARHCYDKASSLIYCELINTEDGIDALFVTNNTDESNGIVSRIPNAKTIVLADEIRKLWGKADRSISEYEEFYEMSPIWRYIYTDRFLVNHNTEYIYNMVTALFGVYEDIFKHGAFDYYFDESIATLQSYIAYYVSKKYGVKYVAFMQARGFDSTHHYIMTEPFQYIYGFEDNYIKKTYPIEIKKQAQDYYDTFINNNLTPDLMNYVRSKPALGVLSIVKGVQKGLRKKYNDKYDYINYRSYIEDLKAPLRFFKYFRFRRFYSPKVNSEDYIYLPLHYEPEAATLVCATKYEKQIFLIDSIVKNLKSNEILYVKDHYAAIGHKTIRFYKDMKRYPNVKIIDPFVSSLDLIRNAKAVITLTGTAGWEAMLFRKPVIIGGKIYYDNAPGVVYLDDIYDGLRTALDNYVQPKEEEVIAYLCEYLCNIFPGCCYFFEKRFLDKENIKKIASSLSHFFKNQK